MDGMVLSLSPLSGLFRFLAWVVVDAFLVGTLASEDDPTTASCTKLSSTDSPFSGEAKGGSTTGWPGNDATEDDDDGAPPAIILLPPPSAPTPPPRPSSSGSLYGSCPQLGSYSYPMMPSCVPSGKRTRRGRNQCHAGLALPLPSKPTLNQPGPPPNISLKSVVTLPNSAASADPALIFIRAILLVLDRMASICSTSMAQVNMRNATVTTNRMRTGRAKSCSHPGYLKSMLSSAEESSRLRKFGSSASPSCSGAVSFSSPTLVEVPFPSPAAEIGSASPLLWGDTSVT
mmetsp:Transcript_16254/g.46845  ORF Transcript_16254/g.46845 Transcript_16254/m.46845 type:complete len:288 (-) Transcript_16254:740-1603(-)